jgi:hypothetical protein
VIARVWLLVGAWLLCLLVGVGIAQRPALLTVWWGRTLNQGLTDWWLVTPAVPRGLSSLRNLANPSRHGTPIAMATPVTATSGVGDTVRVGGFGEIRTDGTDDGVDISSTPLTGVTAFTVGVWVQTTTATVQRVFVAKGGAGGAQYSWNLANGTGSAALATWTSYDCAGSINRSSLTSGTITVNDGRWHHLAVAYNDGVQVDMYADGRLTATTTTFVAGTFCASSTAGMTLAYRADGCCFFAGRLDDVRLWRRILTAPEIRKVYEDSLAGYPDTLVAFTGGPAAALSKPRSRSTIY